jgi:hypothetical protein
MDRAHDMSLRFTICRMLRSLRSFGWILNPDLGRYCVVALEASSLYYFSEMELVSTIWDQMMQKYPEYGIGPTNLNAGLNVRLSTVLEKKHS